MVILEIDGQKYAGQSYLDEAVSPDEYRHALEKLAKEVAETVFIHFGYTGYVESVAVEPEVRTYLTPREVEQIENALDTE